MSNQFPNAAGRPLEALGVSAQEEAIYRSVLAHPDSTIAAVAKQVSITRRLAQQLLDSIEAKGLVTHTPGTPKVYVAASPDFIIDALIKQRKASLERTRLAIPSLMTLAAQSAREPGSEQVLELITSREKMGLIFSQMFTSMRTEAIFFQRAPVLVPTARMSKPLPAGVRVRTISDAGFLEMRGGVEIVRQDIAHGEEARTYPALPFKMMSIDRRIALITLVSDQPEGAVLLIHPSALLDALWLLFEFVWQSATPVIPAGRDGAGRKTQTRAKSPEAADALIPLLSAGLNDKAIIRELGMSSTTLNRRINELMKTYHTRTRFQLGVRIGEEAAKASKRRNGLGR